VRSLLPQDYFCHREMVRMSRWTTEFNFSMHGSRVFAANYFGRTGPTVGAGVRGFPSLN